MSVGKSHNVGRANRVGAAALLAAALLVSYRPLQLNTSHLNSHGLR